MKPWLIIINDFCHDLFTGLWFGSFITLFLLRGRDVGLEPSAVNVIVELREFFFVFCLAALGLIIFTGAMRATYYRNWDSEAMKPIKDRLLIIKHAVLGSSFLIGTLLVFFWR